VNIKINQISALQIFQLIRFSTLLMIGVVFAKLGLSTAEIGQYETFLFLAGAVSFFWLNGLIQGFLPISEKRAESEKSPLFFNVFYLLTAFSALAVIFLILFEGAVSGHLLKSSNIPFFQYLLVYLFVTSPASLVEYIYLLRKEGKEMLVYGAVSYALMFGLVVLPALLGMGMEFSMAGLVASSVFRLVWLFILLFRHSKPGFDKQFIRTHLKCAYPLIFSMLLSGSGQYIDGFIITGYFDDATFAIFRYGAREFPLVLLLANAFSSSMLPEFADSSVVKLSLQKIRQNAAKMGRWLFPLSGAMMLVSHWVFPVVFNRNFSESSTIFNIYLLLIVSRLLFPQTILIGLRSTREIMWASFFEILVNVGLSLWFVQLWGLPGVAYGTVCAYMFEKLFLMFWVKKNFRIHPSEYLNVKQHLLYSLLLSAIFIVVEFVIY
jgi:O-antigen/teichoic acid export membrane protein